MDAIDVDVTVHAEATHDRITVAIENYSTNGIAVRLTQPRPPAVSPSQLTVPPEYDTSAWSENAESLVYLNDIDWGESIETSYAATDLDRETVEEMCRELKIEIRDRDGTDLGTLTDLTPAFADESHDPGTGRNRAAGEPAGPDRDGTVTTGGQAADVEAELNETIDILDDTAAEDSSPASRTDPESRGEEGLEDTRETDGQIGQQTPESAALDQQSTNGGDPTGGEAEDLPARITDYVLEDIDEGVESSEFSWRAVGSPGPDARERPERSGSQPEGPDATSDPDSTDTGESSGGFFSSLLAWF